jgi:hypothetical protein
VTDTQLRASLAAILEAEEQPLIDWQQVDALCDDVLRRITLEPVPDYPFDIVMHFLDDADVRRKDQGYATVQRDRLRAWLNTSR